MNTFNWFDFLLAVGAAIVSYFAGHKVGKNTCPPEKKED
ncbi:MAG: hypothetical protein [Arizlama microvirus]|nr:MAG: hypothetical protein [Arizlama microvirus]